MGTGVGVVAGSTKCKANFSLAWVGVQSTWNLAVRNTLTLRSYETLDLTCFITKYNVKYWAPFVFKFR